jgi:probable F420-dependent oxidoreductase
MGAASERNVLRTSAERAEAAGLDTIWVPDHIAIPPDDTEGSDGRYLDPIASLAWLAAATERIHLGTAVLILPYRPALPTAKGLATVQELSGERLEIGIGVGWMDAEFRALGVDRHARGRLTDETLAFLNEAFGAEDDIVELNDQPFVFRPRPARPRIWVGGAAPHALTRAVRFGDGWLPMTDDPGKLDQPVAELRARFSDAGRPEPEVAVFGALGHRSEQEDLDRLGALEALGVTEFIQGARYTDLDGFQKALDALSERRAAWQARAQEQATED